MRAVHKKSLSLVNRKSLIKMVGSEFKRNTKIWLVLISQLKAIDYLSINQSRFRIVISIVKNLLVIQIPLKLICKRIVR
jgi:hypothetical protein